jgi:sugar phosphate isomerase/epimerase
MNRRTLLGAATGIIGMAAGAGRLATAASSAIDPSASGWFAKRHLPIGLQLYTVGDAARKNIDDTLARVAKIGYRTVELAGYHGQSVQALRATANKHGLKFTSIHVGATGRPGEPGLDQDLPKLAADLHALGVTDVVMPMFPIPERLGGQKPGENFLAYIQRVTAALTRDDWQRTADLLNDRGAKLRAEGLRLGYHNHNPEFAPVGNTTGMEVLLSGTTADQVSFELDVGWVAAAGVDPVALLKRHGRRFQLMHVKDIKPSTQPNFALQQDPTEVGSGKLPWPTLLPAAFNAGVRKFYVEQEPPFAGDRFEAIGKSLAFLKSFEGVEVVKL